MSTSGKTQRRSVIVPTIGCGKTQQYGIDTQVEIGNSHVSGDGGRGLIRPKGQD